MRCFITENIVINARQLLTSTLEQPKQAEIRGLKRQFRSWVHVPQRCHAHATQGLDSHSLLSLTTADLVTQQETLILGLLNCLNLLSKVWVESLCMSNCNVRHSKPHNGAGLNIWAENIAALCAWRLDSQTALALAR